MVSDTEIIESQPVASGTSSQKAELIALTREPLPLQLTREQIYTLTVNIFSMSYTHMLPFGKNEASYLLKALP